MGTYHGAEEDGDRNGPGNAVIDKFFLLKLVPAGQADPYDPETVRPDGGVGRQAQENEHRYGEDTGAADQAPKGAAQQGHKKNNQQVKDVHRSPTTAKPATGPIFYSLRTCFSELDQKNRKLL